jgi:hypothetical protein
LACGVVGTLLLGVSALAIGVVQTLDFISVATYWSSPTFAVSPVNQAPYGLLLRLFTPNAYTIPLLASPMVALVLRVLIVGSVLFVLARSIKTTSEVSAGRLATEYGLVLIGMLLVSPLSEDIHYAYLGLPLIALAAAAYRQWPQQMARLIGLGLVVIYGYLSLPMLHAAKMAFYAFYSAPVAAPQLFLTGVHLYALMALAALAVLALRRLEPRRTWHRL